jgi:hypothetical protein
MQKYMTSLGQYLQRYQYQLLALLLLYKVVIDATYGVLFGDFWEHSAVVHELLHNPFQPSHPLLAIDAPHAFISPYAYLVSGVASLLGLTSIDALVLFGILNFCLLIHALKLLINSIIGGTDLSLSNQTAFIALLLILFLWGIAPWGYSGFFYFDNLTLVLPYPSTFTVILSFYAMAIGFRLKASGDFLALGTIFFICVFVLLSHPLTFISLALCLLAQSFAARKTLFPLIRISMLLVLAICIGLLWPYYSLTALLSGAGDVFHHSNSDMYNHVIARTWPVLVMLPFIAGTLKNKKCQAIFLATVVLVAIYAFGYVSKKYSFGRVVAIILLFLQILIAIGFVRAFHLLLLRWPQLRSVMTLLTVVVLTTIAVTWYHPIFTRSLTVANNLVSGRQLSIQLLYGNLGFITRFLKQNDVVLSDIQTSWMIPSFGGKVVAALHPLPFVPDHATRTEDLIRFFNTESTDTERTRIQQKYQPKFLVLNKWTQPNWESMSAHYSKPGVGTKIYENQQFELILLNEISR